MSLLLIVFLSLFSSLNVRGAVFPHIALGGVRTDLEYQVQVQITNGDKAYVPLWAGDVVLYPTRGGARWEGTLSINGRRYSKGLAAPLHSIPSFPSKGTRTLILRGDEEIRTGFLVITRHTPDYGLGESQIAASMLFRIVRDVRIMDSVGVSYDDGVSNLGHIFELPVSYKAGEHNTGLAWTLRGRRDFPIGTFVSMELYDDSGHCAISNAVPVYQFDASIKPFSEHFHNARFITEFFHEASDEIGEEFVGSVHVRGENGRLSVTGLSLEYVEGGSVQLTSVPAARGSH